jgi:hypothetical protein
MKWRSGRSYSGDLRSRVLATVDGGMAVRTVADVFKVSVSYVYKALIWRRQTGAVEASAVRGHRPRMLTPAIVLLAPLSDRGNRQAPQKIYISPRCRPAPTPYERPVRLSGTV